MALSRSTGAACALFFALVNPPPPAPAQTAKKAAAKPAAKTAPAPAAAHAGKATLAPAALEPGHRGLSRWRGNAPARIAWKTFKFSKLTWKRELTRTDSSAWAAQAVANQSDAALAKVTVDTLARVAFILDVEAPAAAKTFRAKVAKRVVERFGEKVDTGPDVFAQAAYYHELYDVPCRGALSRVGKAWPPQYQCSETPKAPTGDPLPYLRLRAEPRVVAPLSDADPKDKAPPKGSAALAAERRKLMADRDRGDPDLARLENLASQPTRFCVGSQCFSSYAQVAAALYGAGRGQGNLPVFCAPKDRKKTDAGVEWDATTVQCSAQWLDTLGGWQPWNDAGLAAAAPEGGTIPGYACFGSPHLVSSHMIVPAGAAGPSGFHCRKRLFRVLARSVERTAADVQKNIALMCAEMRMQVWGEKYPDINRQYQDWCRKDAARVKRGVCLPPGSPLPGEAGAPPLPFMFLTREELLFFFGHRELFCRADRPGLTHFLYNDKWASTFTCNVPRGLLEGGPFEEGVQVCALSPFVGEEPFTSAVTSEDLKARLHCWKFNRPTCEELSDPAIAEKKDSLHRSAVFDVFDALREARRSQHKDAFGLFDMKDAEKLADIQDKLAFQDQGKDEGTFGVKEFCRFVGDRRKLQCGFTKKTMAQWYELHQLEAPEGCSTGVCARGAYKRGYFCGLMSSGELFSGKLYWMCGIDVGVAGRRILDSARAICVGGARAEKFLSSKGDKGPLQCYERRFRWGESEQSEDVLREFDWGEAVEAAAKHAPTYDGWLNGGDQLLAWAREGAVAPAFALPGDLPRLLEWAKNIRDLTSRPAALNEAFKAGRAHLKKSVEKDMAELGRWAVRYGHTLGHRASMRIGLAASDLSVMKALRALKWAKTTAFEYQPLGMKCSGPACPKLAFKGEAKELARTAELAKGLDELVAEVAKGHRSADERWYQDFRLQATEDGQLRVDPKELELALRVHHVYEVMESARRILLDHARRYADLVFAQAAKAKRLSRLELHERSRSNPIPHRLKGNVYCVSDPSVATASGLPEYICASSALLVAGAVERRSAELQKRLHGNAAAKEKQLRKLRAKIKFGWCYGGTEGFPTFGFNPSRALIEPDASSPYAMEIPASVLGGPVKKAKKKAAWDRLLQLLRRSPGEPSAPSETLDVGRRLLGATAKPAAKPAAKAAAKPKLALASLRGLRLFLTPIQERKSQVNWIKCTGFQYSDENWELADPARDKKKGAAAPAAVAAAPSGGDPRAGDETAKIMKEVGGLLISVVKLVLPKFGDAIERVQDLAHAATEFYDKYVKRFVDLAKAVWDAARGNLQGMREQVAKLRGDLEGAIADARKAAVNAAKPQPSEQALAKAKEAEADADAKIKALQNQINEGEKAFDNSMKASQKSVTIPNTGELLSPLLDELVKVATERVTAVIDPNARSLLSKGFKFIRNFLDPIAQSVISALAGIPFVGAALAALGQVAYSYAMDALENAAGDALMGLVERLLSKLLRTVMTPVFKVVSKKILELAVAFCPAIMGEHSRACPQEVKFAALPEKDRWIERALACKPRPILDERVYRDAALAEHDILRRVTRMRRNVAVYARDLADRYLARFGLSYDAWMAAVGEGATPAVVARASEIGRALREAASKLRTPLRP